MAIITSLEELRAGNVLRGEAIAMRAFDGPATVRPATDEVLYVLERDEGMFVPAGAEVKIDSGTVIAVSGGQTILSVQTGRIACPPLVSTGSIACPPLVSTGRIACPPPVRLADQPIQ